MKKLIQVIALLLVALLLFAACSTTNTPAASPSAAPESPAANGDNGTVDSDKTIAILMQSVADEFIYSVYKAAETYAQNMGYNTTFSDAKNDAAAQASAVEDAITQGVDAIMLCPVDASALSDSVAKINEAKIPVVLVDRTIESGDYVAVCQSDNYEFGYQGAKEIVTAAEKADLDVKDLKVLELQGDLSSTSGLDRSKGFQQAAEDLGLNIVSSLPTYWETDTAYNAALDALQGNPDINAIFLASDGVMGDAVVNALEQIDRLYPIGDDNHIIITAVDGTPASLELIRDKYLDATCAQPAILMAESAIDMLDKALKGEVALDAKIDNSLAPTVGTIDNVDSDELWANSK
ncbi:MAG: sugar ABC transporter substrate-binding protein [Christensenellales bacterium]